MTTWLHYALLPLLREWLDSPWFWFGLLSLPLVVWGCTRLVNPWLRFRITMAAFRKSVANVFTPFSVIASELRRMNDLKELELTERLNPVTGKKDPIYIISEIPSVTDTEIFFGNDEPPKGIAGMRERLARHWDSVPDEDE